MYSGTQTGECVNKEKKDRYRLFDRSIPLLTLQPLPTKFNQISLKTFKPIIDRSTHDLHEKLKKRKRNEKRETRSKGN